MNRSPRSVCVLLSTYNGERFLRQQIDSVRAQVDCQLTFLIRDDGSTDSTLSVLRSYESQDARIAVTSGPNVGVIASFFELLKAAPAGAAAYFFCDQDDLWDADKAAAALRALAAVDSLTPALYCSRLRYIDSNNDVLGTSASPRCVGLANALVENVAVGCSSALNPAARQAILDAPPRATIMHDWWCYLVVSVMGRVIYDPTPHIGYRLHDANVVGAGSSLWQDLRLRLRRRRGRRTAGGVTRAEQAAELRKLLGARMSEQDRRLVDDFVLGRSSLLRRLRLVGRGAVKRSGSLNQAILNCQLLLNDY